MSKLFANGVDGVARDERVKRIDREDFSHDPEWLDELETLYGDPRTAPGKVSSLQRRLEDWVVIPSANRNAEPHPRQRKPAPEHDRIAIGVIGGQDHAPANEFSLLLGGATETGEKPKSAETIAAEYDVARASHLRNQLLALLREESASRRDLILLLSAHEPKVASMALTLLHSRLVTVRGQDPLAVLERVTGGAAKKIAAGTWGAQPGKRRREDDTTLAGAVRSFDPLENGRTVGNGLEDARFAARVRAAETRAGLARSARRGGRTLRALGRSMFDSSLLVEQLRDPARRVDQSSGGLLSSVARRVGATVNEFLDTPEGPALSRRTTSAAAVARRGESSVNEDELSVAELEDTGSGQPLPQQLATRMRRLLGHDFSHVRVHIGGKSDRSADKLQARAFTIGSNIHFRAHEWAPGTLAFERLLIHELTHVIQFDQGRLRPESGKALTDPDGAAEREARAAESKAGTAPREPEPGPRLRLGEAGKKRSSSGSGKTAAPKKSKSVGEKVFLKVVRRVSPQLAKLIDVGPGQMIKDALKKGVKGFVKGAMKGGSAVAGVAGKITGAFSKAFGFIKGLLSGDPGCCEAVTNAIQAIRDVASAIANNPVVKTVKSVLGKVNGAIKKLGTLILSPVFNMLKKVAGGAWRGIKAIAKKIGEWTSSVKAAMTKAYKWVMKKLGLGGGGGIWDWIKKQAKKIWKSIAKTLKPIAGPLKAVAASLLMFTGLPQIYALIKYGPKVVDAVKWLWANKGDPKLIVKARAKFGPALGTALSAIKGLGAAMTGAANWLMSAATKVATSVLSLLGAISGVPLLSMAKGLVSKIKGAIKKVATWAKSTFKAAVADVKAGAAKFAAIIKPYQGILTSIGMAIANPTAIPMILAGWAWQALPDCIKGPIIDLLLDALIAFLQALPNLIMLGPLWPMLKAGVIGFFQGVRAQDTATKVAVSNKVAKIISGGSPAFILGFAKGLAAGLWEGLTDPFKMIWSLVSGLHRLLAWFEGTSVADSAKPDSDTKTAKKRPEAPAAKTGGGADKGKEGGGTATLTQGAPAGGTEEATLTKGGGATGGGDAAAEAPAASAPAPAPAGTINAVTSKPTVKEFSSTIKRMGGELKEPISTASSNVMPAAKEAFAGGPGITFEGLMAKLGKWWATVEGAIRSAAGTLAAKACQFMMGDGAEGKLGEGAGWLVGTIAFELLLNYFTGTAYAQSKYFSKAVQTVARILDWTGEAMSLAFKGLAKAGGMIKKGIGGIAELIGKTASGSKVIGALKDLAAKLGRFANELLGRFGKGVTTEAAQKAAKEGGEKASKEAAEKAAKEGAETASEKAGKSAAKEAEEKAAKEAGEKAAKETTEKGGKEAGEKAGKNADEAGEKAGKKGDDGKGKKGDDDNPHKNKTDGNDVPDAEKTRVAAMAAITAETMDQTPNVPTIAIVAALKTAYMPKYRWIKDFQAERIGPGKFQLYMIASKKALTTTNDDNVAPKKPKDTPDKPKDTPDKPKDTPDKPKDTPDAGGGKPKGETPDKPRVEGKNKGRDTLTDDKWKNLTDDERKFINDYMSQFPNSKIPDDEILDAYRKGLVPGKGGGFVDPEKARKATDKAKPLSQQKAPDGGWTPENVHKKLTEDGKSLKAMEDSMGNMTPPKPDFDPQKALKDIADGKNPNLKPPLENLSEDAIRHELKQQAQNKVFNQMDEVLDNPALRKKMYPDLFPDNLPADKLDDAIAAAQHRRITELTDKLNSKDRGEIIERWYKEKRLGGIDHAPQVKVTADDVPGLELKGKTGTKGEKGHRAIDAFSNGTAVEVKSGDGLIDPHQLDDYLKMVGKEVRVNGVKEKVEALHYVFTSSKGAKANAASIKKILQSGGSVEVYDKAGRQIFLEDLDDLAKLASL